MSSNLNLFVAVWNLVGLVQSDYRLHDRVKELFSAGKLRDSPFAEFVLYELNHFPLSHGIDRLELADRLLAQGNRTPWLLRFRAESLTTQGRFVEAFEDYKQFSEMLPIYPMGISAPKCLIRDRKYLEAREFTARWAAISTKDDKEAAAVGLKHG